MPSYTTGYKRKATTVDNFEKMVERDIPFVIDDELVFTDGHEEIIDIEADDGVLVVDLGVDLSFRTPRLDSADVFGVDQQFIISPDGDRVAVTEPAEVEGEVRQADDEDADPHEAVANSLTEMTVETLREEIETVTESAIIETAKAQDDRKTAQDVYDRRLADLDEGDDEA